MTADVTAYASYERATRKVRMSTTLMDYIVETLGRVQEVEIRLDWGGPDEEGFYTPTLTVLNRPTPSHLLPKVR